MGQVVDTNGWYLFINCLEALQGRTRDHADNWICNHRNHPG